MSRSEQRDSKRPVGITLIVIQKSLWAACLIACSVLLLWFRAEHVTQPIRTLFAHELVADPHGRFANLLVRLIPHLSLRGELALGIGAAVYAVLEVVEAWGLW